MNELQEYLLECGASAVGYADVREFPPQARRGYPRAVSIALAVPPRAVARLMQKGCRPPHPDGGLYAALMAYAQMAVTFLASRGASAEVAHVTAQAAVQHKAVATRAGLGWVGKCNLLINRDFGAALRLATVLTDAELPTAEPVDHSRCGDCTECTDICPVQAPSGRNWRKELLRDQFFEWRRCRDLKRSVEEHGEACGLCMGACPFTRHYLRKHGVYRPKATTVSRTIRDCAREVLGC